MSSHSFSGHRATEELQDTQIDFRPPQHNYIVSQPFSSAFFKDHNEEEYLIQRAFKASNFTSLRKDIPKQLKYGSILEQRLNKVQDIVEEEACQRRKSGLEKEDEKKQRLFQKKMEQIGQLGYFEVFPYQESLYNIEHDLNLQKQQESKRQQSLISPIEFRPVGFDRKMKYENPFSHIDRLQSKSLFKEQYLFPFHVPEDTYDQFHYSELRRRILEEGAKIAGEFVPAQNEKSLSKVNRSRASEILKDVEEYLKKYTLETGFFIGLSKRDHIDILFDFKEANNPRINMVMSRLCEHETLSKYLLRRDTASWGRKGQSGYLQYCVLPPWVKHNQELLSKTN